MPAGTSSSVIRAGKPETCGVVNSDQELLYMVFLVGPTVAATLSRGPVFSHQVVATEYQSFLSREISNQD